MATDTASSVDSPAPEVSEEAYLTPIADFLLIAAIVSVVALGAAGVILL
jgi:hypothetical protein